MKEEQILKDIYKIRNWKNSFRTLYWIFRDFSLISIIKILLYYFKKKTNTLDISKVIELKFKFYGKKLRVKLRENDDDFSILRGIFLLGSYTIPSHKSYEMIIDGGSHLGFFAIYYNTINPNSKIICIEPSKKTLELLKYNIFINKIKAEIVPFAVSDKEKNVKFEYNELNPSFSKIDPKGKFTIKTTTLDKIIDKLDLKKIDLLKLDIEGYEIIALNGLVKNNKKVKEIICENHHKMYDSNELFKKIKSKGFKLMEIPHYRFIYKGIKDPLVYGKKNLNTDFTK